MKEKPRLSRLTAILTQLQSKRIVSAPYLAERHGVSIRTIYRDIRTLEQSGIPIITEPAKGYSLMEGYQLSPVMFTETEANALITAEQIIRKNKDASLIENYGKAITKIKAILRYSQKEQAELLSERLQYRENPTGEKTSTYLMQIQSAIIHFLLCELHYVSLQGQRTHRTVEPFALYSTQGNWVLIAFCRLRQGFRAFRVDQIEKLNPQNTTFEPHRMTLEDYLRQCREKYSNNPDIPLS